MDLEKEVEWMTQPRKNMLTSKLALLADGQGFRKELYHYTIELSTL
jgi:hypothetical protein